MTRDHDPNHKGGCCSVDCHRARQEQQAAWTAYLLANGYVIGLAA